jgi:hypothetical protein
MSSSACARPSTSSRDLLFNVKALSDEVQSLSNTMQHVIKTMRPGAAEDEARRQLH